MKKFIKLGLICILLTACGDKTIKTINTNEALELINDGAIIVDVRTRNEYDNGHIKDAINVPLDEIETLDYDKETTLIVYCASGVRSLEAVNILKNKGYTSLYNLDGGLINWGSEIEK